jgi:hypothetical protein
MREEELGHRDRGLESHCNENGGKLSECRWCSTNHEFIRPLYRVFFKVDNRVSHVTYKHTLPPPQKKTRIKLCTLSSRKGRYMTGRQLLRPSSVGPVHCFQLPSTQDLPSPTRVDKKNYSAEDGIGGTTGFFRRNSGCSAECKTLGIPFRTIPRKRKML